MIKGSYLIFIVNWIEKKVHICHVIQDFILNHIINFVLLRLFWSNFTRVLWVVVLSSILDSLYNPLQFSRLS